MATVPSSASVDTKRAASAVLLAARTSAVGRFVRRYLWHCAVATGIDRTWVMSSSR